MARNLKYTYWRDGEFFIGSLNNYPDYRTQGTSKEDLVENLKLLLEDIESDEIPFIRKVIQTDFNASGSPFSLREKVRMRGIKSNIFVDDFDPLTPTLSRREREKNHARPEKTGTLEVYPKFQNMFG